MGAAGRADSREALANVGKVPVTQDESIGETRCRLRVVANNPETLTQEFGRGRVSGREFPPHTLSNITWCQITSLCTPCPPHPLACPSHPRDSLPGPAEPCVSCSALSPGETPTPQPQPLPVPADPKRHLRPKPLHSIRFSLAPSPVLSRWTLGEHRGSLRRAQGALAGACFCRLDLQLAPGSLCCNEGLGPLVGAATVSAGAHPHSSRAALHLPGAPAGLSYASSREGVWEASAPPRMLPACSPCGRTHRSPRNTLSPNGAAYYPALLPRLLSQSPRPTEPNSPTRACCPQPP